MSLRKAQAMKPFFSISIESDNSGTTILLFFHKGARLPSLIKLLKKIISSSAITVLIILGANQLKLFNPTTYIQLLDYLDFFLKLFKSLF